MPMRWVRGCTVRDWGDRESVSGGYVLFLHFGPHTFASIAHIPCCCATTAMRPCCCTFLMLPALVQPAHPFMAPALALSPVERWAKKCFYKSKYRPRGSLSYCCLCSLDHSRGHAPSQAVVSRYPASACCLRSSLQSLWCFLVVSNRASVGYNHVPSVCKLPTRSSHGRCRRGAHGEVHTRCSSPTPTVNCRSFS